jgi:serine protease Do
MHSSMETRGLLRSWKAWAVLLSVFLIGGLVGSRAARPNDIPSLAPLQTQDTPAEPALTASFHPIVKQVVPAVVSITAEKVVRTSGMQAPFFFGPFGDLFGGPGQEPQERRAQGLGSGVIVTPDGYVLTNHHVIEGAENIDIRLDDGRDLKAKVVGTDAKTDLAILKVEAKDLPVVRFGNSGNVKVGDVVLAIGSPFGLRQSVTMGIVGGTGRGNLRITGQYEDFIQTDAAINPGNSGGALINIRGELIGINTAIFSRSGGNQGIGFAVPVNMAHRVMTQIIEHGKVTRGYIGVGIQDLTPELARQFGAPGPGGALVRSVEPGSPADQAGLQQGDVVLEVNGQAVEDSRTLSLTVAGKDPGTTVDLTVWRDSKKMRVPLKLGEFPEDQQAAKAAPGSSSNALEGLSVDTLTPAVARQLNLDPGTQGVVVTRVAPGSAAAEAGLQRGDVIEQVARKPVAGISEFQAAVRQAGDGPVLLLVNRGGSALFVVVEPRK